eukprot:361100-Chlamydomonas_euryale.AAC.28
MHLLFLEVPGNALACVVCGLILHASTIVSSRFASVRLKPSVCRLRARQVHGPGDSAGDVRAGCAWRASLATHGSHVSRQIRPDIASVKCRDAITGGDAKLKVSQRRECSAVRCIPVRSSGRVAIPAR